eukprot:GHVN01037579.1.p1 GENE.GHVN01037579.1~~GHVN01037579.1.p1  ORF type:complete len:541 (+),score=96.96 GHVN01037579.1:94-1716(+)
MLKTAAPMAPGGANASKAGDKMTRNERQNDIRSKNIIAAKAVADMIRTSLGPRGMDKMIQDSKGGVVITNDGATILNQLGVKAPTAKMLVELSKAQDVEAGDGTTSVVVIAGAFLVAAQQLLDKGIHAQFISQCLIDTSKKAAQVLEELSFPVNLDDREHLIQSASTALNSKVVSSNAPLLAPMAVDAVMKIYNEQQKGAPLDLRDVKVVKKLGGTVEDTEMVDGLVFADQKVSKVAGGPSRIEDAKIGLIQFCLSPPKTDMENQISVKDYQAMDRLLREERMIIAKQVKAIRDAGCNVLLVQKSILRDAVTDLSLDYLAKAKILVIRDIEREDVEFISRTLKCQPVASLDHFTPDKLGTASLVTEEDIGAENRIVRICGVPSVGTVSVLCRASNELILEETERSLHDALCVVRCLVKRPALLPGGAAAEMELVYRLTQWARTLEGVEQLCVKAFAEALEVIPYTLAENAGMRAIEVVTELRNRHANGEKNSGINVRNGGVSDMKNEKVIQPLMVSLSAVTLAAETVMMILKIDDIVQCK